MNGLCMMYVCMDVHPDNARISIAVPICPMHGTPMEPVEIGDSIVVYKGNVQEGLALAIAGQETQPLPAVSVGEEVMNDA